MVPQGSPPGNVRHPQSVAVANGPAHADVAAAIAEPLRELLGHDVGDWHRFGFESVKERTVRTVLRGTLGDVPVHLKAFRPDTLADRARDAVRRPRGAAEAEHLAAARALGLPAVEVLAHGMAADHGQRRSFVVTRTIVGAEPFTFAVPVAVQAAVGKLLRSVHELGLELADLHPGNLVVDGTGGVWLLDLTSMRRGGPPSPRRRAAALATFCQDLDGGACDRRAAALLDAYLAAGTPLPASFRRELELATHRWRAAALKSFGRRATRTCRHTFVEPRRRGQPRWHVHLAAGAPTDVVSQCTALLADPGPPLRQGRRGGVWLQGACAWKEREAGAARQLWCAAYWLQFAGVPAAAPVALRLDRGRGQVFHRNLERASLATELAGHALDARAIAGAARSLGDAVGRLHAHGLRCRDLKFDNLVREPAATRVCLVDLDGVRRTSTDDTRGQGADLGRLLAAFRGANAPGGAATVRTFLRAYLRAHRTLLQRPPLRRLLRRAEQRAGEWASAHRG